MSNIIENIKSSFDLHVVESDDYIEIHFGEIANEKVSEIHKKIELKLISLCVYGVVSIITTPGNIESLITVLYYKNESIENLKIEHI